MMVHDLIYYVLMGWAIFCFTADVISSISKSSGGNDGRADSLEAAVYFAAICVLFK